MHIFQRLALEKICRQHNLDTQLIDNTLNYSENKKYLVSLIPKDDKDLAPLSISLEEWYMKEHFLSYYLSVRQRKP